jgi:dolichol-phosphate mannosyltransferase
VVDALHPLISSHFNLTVEMPLKAIVRGYSHVEIPIRWTNRRHGVSKLKIKEMGSRYLFIVLWLWLEKHLSRGDYHRLSRDAARLWKASSAAELDGADSLAGRLH